MIDGKLQYYGELTQFARLLNYINNNVKNAILPEAKLKSMMKVKDQEEVFLSEDETKTVLKALRAGKTMAHQKQQPYTERTFSYFIDDLQCALVRYGRYAVQKETSSQLEYAEDECVSGYNTHPEVLNLLQQYFQPTLDASVALGGDVIGYAQNDQRAGAPLVIVIVDAHLPEHQDSVKRMFTDYLYPAGFRTLFSESDPYYADHQLSTARKPRGSVDGMRDDSALYSWPVPRSAEALEFYYGKDLDTYGAEDPSLYQGFARYARPSVLLEEFIPASQARSYAIADNLTQHIQFAGIDKAVLICGGEHLESLAAELDANASNYVIVYPRGGVPIAILNDIEFFSKE